jgi:hypothetical protein
MSFTYNGININELVTSGTSTVLDNSFVNFPSFTTSNYSTTDRPLDFKYYYGSNVSTGGSIINQSSIQARYLEYTVNNWNNGNNPTQVNPPDWTNRIHIIAIGGGGGFGGTGGCGYGGFPIKRHPGGGGGPGAPGEYVAYTEDGNDPTAYQIGISLGRAGTNGNGGNTRPGNSPGPGGPAGPGNSGNATTVTTYFTIGASGGGGGDGGSGGNEASSNSPKNTNAVNPAYANNVPIFNTYPSNPNGYTAPIPANYNPLNYLNTYGGATQNGIVRIYLLKS